MIDEVELMKEGIKDLLEENCEMGIGKGPKEESPSIMNKLESNGIGKGLIKNNPYLDEISETEDPEPEDPEAAEPEIEESETEDTEVKIKTNNGNSQKDEKVKKVKTNNGKSGK